MKKLVSLLLLVLFLFVLASCTPETTVRAAFLKGPTGIGAASLMDSGKYDVTLAGSNDVITAGLLNGSLDIAAVASNLAAVLNAKSDGNIRILAVNTFGGLHILSKSPLTLSELTGQTLTMAGKGAVPEYVLTYLLNAYGVEDVTVNYATEHAETASLAMTGRADIVLVPEPFATNITSKNPSYAYDLDLNEVYKSLTGDDLPMGVLVVRNDWAEAHPRELEAFLADYEASTFAVSDVEATALLCEKYGIISADVARLAIPRCRITYVQGDRAETMLDGFFRVLYECKPASVGGKIPTDYMR